MSLYSLFLIITVLPVLSNSSAIKFGLSTVFAPEDVWLSTLTKDVVTKGAL